MYMTFPGVYEIPAQYHSMQERQALDEKRKQIFQRIDEAYERYERKSLNYNPRKELPEKEAETDLYLA